MTVNVRTSIKRGVMVASLAALAPATLAQTQINGSGATLFVDFFGLAGGTNDVIDVDGDGVYGFDFGTFAVDQLAPGFSLGSTPTGHWIHHYRSVGSVNGYKEFVDSQLFGGPPYVINTGVPSEAGILNRTRYAESGAILYGGAHDGTGYPTGGLTPRDQMPVDFAFLDVPSLWGTRIEGSTAVWNAKPGSTGYGTNLIQSTTGRDNRLVSIERDVNGNGTIEANEKLNFNTATPDANTLFDTPVAFVPVTAIANRGVGIDTIKASTWQHGALTGRSETGENLQFTTRDTGSGTHNAWMNSLGIDPSWGMGENVGEKEKDATKGQLGAGHVVGNAGGSSVMEEIVQHSRLAVGYTGLFGGSRSAADVAVGKYELLSVINDHNGGTVAIRPSVENVVDNLDPNTGWQIGGSGSFVTRGDPFATGFDASATSGYVNIANANPAMTNVQAALYLQNLLESIGQFAGATDNDNDGIIDVIDPDLNNDGTVDNDNNQLNMPGEVLALNYTLVAGVDGIQDLNDPTNFVDQTGTSEFNQLVQDFIKDFSVTTVPGFGTVNDAGLSPLRRNTGVAYADGQLTNYAYIDSTGTKTLAGKKKLSEVNRVQGDFNHDGARNMNDIQKLMEAVNDPLNFEAGVDHSGSHGDMTEDIFIAHVVGDFDGNGNLDQADIRFFADGLAMDTATGKLDRKQGFELVDTHAVTGDTIAGGRNYFGTTLQTGKAYELGDSRGDIAHRDGANNDASSAFIVSPGAAPTGADGVIDWADIDYVMSQFTHLTGGFASGEVDWANQSTLGVTANPYDASHPLIRLDLSADITGDLKINKLDVEDLVRGILGTEFGDANLDGAVSILDLNILGANFGAAGGWADGDFNGDGQVTVLDLNTLGTYFGFGSSSSLSFDEALVLTDLGGLVPEPGTLALLGLGGLGLLARRRR